MSALINRHNDSHRYQEQKKTSTTIPIKLYYFYSSLLGMSSKIFKGVDGQRAPFLIPLKGRFYFHVEHSIASPREQK